MHVTTGKMIIVEAGFNKNFRFERDSQTPGIVTVYKTNSDKMPLKFTLPGNVEDATRFVEGYLRTVQEDIGYAKEENEQYDDYADEELESLRRRVRKMPPNEQKELFKCVLHSWPAVGAPTEE
jgi:ribosomal protein S2